jgi:hypothetical protein
MKVVLMLFPLLAVAVIPLREFTNKRSLNHANKQQKRDR